MIMKLIVGFYFVFGGFFYPNQEVSTQSKNFVWVAFDSLLSKMAYGSNELFIETEIIRRKNYKCRGKMTVFYDSTLYENFIKCTPIDGDSICPSYFDYFILDSTWFNVKFHDKFKHRLLIRKIALEDTMIQQASTNTPNCLSDSSNPKLDFLLEKKLFAHITITKKRILQHDGMNYQDIVNTDINKIWIKK